jgi:hypothetical protein
MYNPLLAVFVVPDTPAVARMKWTRGLQIKESLTRVEITVTTLLRIEHIGLSDYLFR